MAKPLFQDIIPPDKRSIKRVTIPQRAERGSRREEESVSNSPVAGPIKTARRLKIPDDERLGGRATANRPVEKVVSQKTPPPLRRVPFYEEKNPYRRHFPWKAVIVFILAAAIITGTYLVMSRYATATITITPKVQSVTLTNTPFTGIAITSSSSSPAALPTSVLASGPIPYQIISLTKDGSMGVSSTGQVTIATKASGQITIFNNNSTSPQKLISGTRFATPSGLVYRMGNAVNVPGKTGTTPGSITVSVTADQPGNQYNIDQSDFVIPGLSGTPAYKNIYARAETPMTGGFSGIEPKVDPATLAAAQATIDAELKGALITDISHQIPANEILLPNAYVVTYEHITTTAASSSQAVVSEEGTIHVFAFNTAQLANAIVLAVSTDTPDALSPTITTWQFNDPSGLQFSLISSASTTGTSWNLSPLPFKISGTTNLTATINTEGIKGNLSGKAKSDFNPILSGFPGISSATMSIQPFWEQNFPVDSKNINIHVSQVQPGD